MTTSATDPNALELYHYLDEDGLDSLYSQCSEYLVERLTNLEKRGELDAEAELETGKLLSLVGLGSGTVTGSLSLNRLKAESLKSVFRVEHRLPVVLEFLRSQGQLTQYREPGGECTIRDGYVLFEGLFQTPSFEEVLRLSRGDSMDLMAAAFFGDKERLRPRGFVEFRAEAPGVLITMGTSLGKYKTGLHHLMLMWKQETGLPDKVRLRVFGYVRKTGDRQLYLKPFMIAQAPAPA